MVSLTFENPIYLWYLLSIPFLIYTHFYFMRHNNSKSLKFANFEVLKRVTGEKLITRNYTVLFIRMAIILCMIFAVSGTVLWLNGSINDNDFVIAIDVSASMSAQDIIPSRIDAAKSSGIDFINNLNSRSNIGIVTFSSISMIETIPIDNKATLKKVINNIELQKAGGTDVSGAIITSTNLLAGSEKGKAIVLITDGSNTVSGFIDDTLKESLTYAQENHVIIHTIGIGSESGPIGYLPEYYNISAIYNKDVLIDISNSTGGFYFEVFDQESLIKAQEEISKASTVSLIPFKLNYGLMLISLLLLFIEWGLINTRFRKLP